MDEPLVFAEVDSTWCGVTPNVERRYDISGWAGGEPVQFIPLTGVDREAVARILADIQREPPRCHEH